MGIHGLATYLRENRSSLATIRTLEGAFHGPSEGADAGPGVPPPRTPIVVDGWSFIFELTHCATSDLPWVYGGEYPALAALVREVVQAWIDVGLSLYFVFDGPYPSIKFPTLVSRATQNCIQPALLFFRTSAAARAAPRFLHETRMLPPLVYSVCVSTLIDLAAGSSTDGFERVNGADEPRIPPGTLEVHFADEEGDPYAVALAGRLHAYVAGRDSDFVVLNTDGYKGYIPLDEMVWIATPRDALASTSDSVYSESAHGDADADEEDASGFRTVRSAKTRKRALANQRAGRGLVPPGPAECAGGTLSLSFAVYAPAVLAVHLALPASLLPLLGALVGNDFTGTVDGARSGKHDLQRFFFERRLTPVQRIVRAAGALRGIIVAAFPAAPTMKKRRGKQVGSVMELIDAAVTALLLRADGLVAGERDTVVERIVEATLQYALPRCEGKGGAAWASDVCALHTRGTCPLYASLTRGRPVNGAGGASESRAESSVSDIDLDWEPSDADEPSDHRIRVSELYIAAYRRGALSPRVLDATSTATSWSRPFLEDPDKETIARSVGRPLRAWGYALLGAGMQTGTDDAVEDADKDDDDDELVDVEEEDDEDLLAPLRGALQQLDGSGNDVSSILGSSSSSAAPNAQPALPKIVVEYVRRGTRLASEEVSVPTISDILAFAADMAVDKSLPVQLWPAEARLTLLLRLLRADSTRVRALSREQRMVVLVVRWIVELMHTRAVESGGNKEREMEQWSRAEASAFLAAFSLDVDNRGGDAEPAPIMGRHVQLVAQVLTALDSLQHLVQILLLAEEVPSPAHLFSGRRVHLYLTDMQAAAAAATVFENGVWAAFAEGLDGAFTEPKTAKRKERRKNNGAGAHERSQTKIPTKVGLYGLLADMDA